MESCAIILSRVTFATIEAAAICGTLASPFTIARAGNEIPGGTSKPSTRTGASMFNRKIARDIASSVMFRIPCLSIIEGVDQATATRATRRISIASLARILRGRSLLSSSSPNKQLGIAEGSNHTAATRTGPQRLPLPTSSHPITASNSAGFDESKANPSSPS